MNGVVYIVHTIKCLIYEIQVILKYNGDENGQIKFKNNSIVISN